MSIDIQFELNGETVRSNLTGDTPLIYALRNDQGINGTRFGCGLAQCGACTVLLDGQPVRSCVLPIAAVADMKVTTLEGLGTPDEPHPLQQAFIDEQAMQCGYCCSGIMMTASAFLERNPTPSESDIREALDGHICRCGTHTRIIRAVQTAARAVRKSK